MLPQGFSRPPNVRLSQPFWEISAPTGVIVLKRLIHGHMFRGYYS